MSTNLWPLGVMPPRRAILDLIVRAILHLLRLYIRLALLVFRNKLRFDAEHSTATCQVKAVPTTRWPGSREPFALLASILLTRSSVFGYIARLATFCFVLGTIAEYRSILHARPAWCRTVLIPIRHQPHGIAYSLMPTMTNNMWSICALQMGMHAETGWIAATSFRAVTWLFIGWLLLHAGCLVDVYDNAGSKFLHTAQFSTPYRFTELATTVTPFILPPISRAGLCVAVQQVLI